MFTYPRTRAVVRKLAVVIAALTVVAQGAKAQTGPTPVPFISAYAGIAPGQVPVGTQCTTGIPVYSPTGTGASYGDGCPATQATLLNPVYSVTDKLGNVFIADQGNNNHMLVRVVYNAGAALAAAITASNVQSPGLVPQKGFIYTIAGSYAASPVNTFCNQSSGPAGINIALDGCPGVQTEQGPRGLAVDADGNVFISGVSPTSEIRVFYVGGTAAANLIKLENPTPAVTPQPGFVYRIAGGNSSADTGDGALASKAAMNTPRGLIVDANENIIFADQANFVVRRVDSTTGFISTIAGTHCSSATTAPCSATGNGDGASATAATAGLDDPYDVALDQYGNLFIAEAGGTTASPYSPGRIRVVYAAGTVPGLPSPASAGNIYTYAGGTATTGTQAQQATFQEAFGVSIDAAGYLYVTDSRNSSSTTGSNRIWRVDPVNGNILVWAGTGGATLANGNHCDRTKQVNLVSPDALGDTCPAPQAYINLPQGRLGFDNAGNAFYAEKGSGVIRKLYFNNVFPATAVGATSVSLPQAFYFPTTTTFLTKSATLQGMATTEFVTTSTTATDTCPIASPLPTAPDVCVSMLAFAPAASGTRSAVYNYSDATGIVATEPVSGVGIAPVFTISPASSVTIGTGIAPSGVSTDLRGNVYVSDTTGKQVLASTVAGGAGTAVLTGLGSPRQSTTDNFGNLYVVDATANTLVKHAAGVTATTGTAVVSGLNAPRGAVADLFGNVYIADTGNNRLLYYNAANGNTTPVSTYPVVLSAPTSLSLDSAGDVFVVDTNHTRVVELPLGGLPQLVTLPNGVAPTAIAFDPAGDAFEADATSGSIVFMPTGTTTATTLINGVTGPASLAVSTSGNVFVADSSKTAATAYNFAVNNSTFGTTNVQLTSLPITLSLYDFGNASATLSTPPFVETGSASAFPASGTATCAAAFVIAPGANCTQTFVFSPTVPGPQGAMVVFNTTTAQSVTANFNGTATNLILTSVTIAPTNVTTNYGKTTTYTVTFTPASTGASAPSGMIAFVVDGTQVSSLPVPSSAYVFTLSTTVAVHSVSAVYSGDALYAGSNVTTLLTVNKATTTTTASSQQTSAGTVLNAVVTPGSVGALGMTGSVIFYVDGNPVANVGVGTGTVTATVLVADGTHTFYATYVGDGNYATSTSTPVQTLIVSRIVTTLALTITPTATNGAGGLLLSAKLTAAGAGTPTGTVSFYNGTTLLGTVNVSTAVNGVITFTTTSFTFANPSFTATYSGDGLFGSSTATAIEGADFIVVPVAPTSPLTVFGVAQGSQITISAPVTPLNGYTGTLTPSCSNLPTNAICRFQPTTISLTTAAATPFAVQFFAGVSPNVASVAPARFGKTPETLFALLLLSPLALAVRRRKKLGLLAVMLLAVATLGVAGCGNKVPGADPKTYLSPVGLSTFTLTLTDANGLSRSVPITINITQ